MSTNTILKKLYSDLKSIDFRSNGALKKIISGGIKHHPSGRSFLFKNDVIMRALYSEAIKSPYFPITRTFEPIERNLDNDTISFKTDFNGTISHYEVKILKYEKFSGDDYAKLRAPMFKGYTFLKKSVPKLSKFFKLSEIIHKNFTLDNGYNIIFEVEIMENNQLLKFTSMVTFAGYNNFKNIIYANIILNYYHETTPLLKVYAGGININNKRSKKEYLFENIPVSSIPRTLAECQKYLNTTVLPYTILMSNHFKTTHIFDKNREILEEIL